MIFVEEFFHENMISWTEIFGQLMFQMSSISLYKHCGKEGVSSSQVGI